jgi:hypothetical protein
MKKTHIKNKKAAMEMSVGTIVTIVLLMTVLVLGLVLVQTIFQGATESVDSINDQIRGEIDNLFNTENSDVIVSLGTKHSASVKQGTDNFGFVFGFSPDDPSVLNDCTYDISAKTGGDFCNEDSTLDVEKWIITGITDIEFDESGSNAAYALVKMKIPETTPICLQRFNIKIDCNGDLQTSYFDISIIKKGLF